MKNQNNNNLQIAAREYIIYFLVFVLLIVLRRPEAIFHPEFWAEDGVYWYQQAYKIGFSSIFMPENGYLQSISRLVALISQPFPLSFAPAIFAISALTVQVAPIAILLSKRFEYIIKNKYARIIICLIYVVVPNSLEPNINLTDAQWHLSLVLFLLIVSDSYKHSIIEYTTIIVSALSGPFSILMSPIIIFEAYNKYKLMSINKYIIALACTFIQSYFLIVSMVKTRSTENLGASIKSFATIFVNNIFIGGTFGRLGKPFILSIDNHVYVFFVFLFVLIAVAFILGSKIYKEFVFFSAAIIGTALVSPMVSLTQPQWPVMEAMGAGDRYYVIPIIAMNIGFLVLAFNKNLIIKIIGIFMLLIFFLSAPFNFLYNDSPYKNIGFYREAMLFYKSNPGTTMKFNETPSGWNFYLIKK
jgi:hypothetical protein